MPNVQWDMRDAATLGHMVGLFLDTGNGTLHNGQEQTRKVTQELPM